MSFNFDDSDLDNAEAHNEGENVIKGLRAKIYRLTTAWKDQGKLLQICDDKEAKLKEDILILKIKLEELENFEEGMRKQYKVNVEEVENLESEVVSSRKYQ